MHLIIIVQTVGTQQFDQGLILYLHLRDIRQIDTCCVTLVFHIQSELILLHRRGEVIHVLHHQVPVTLFGVVAGVLQRLDEERLTHIGDIAGELTHLVGCTAVSVFVSHGQHLIGLERGVQRHITQCPVQRIFRGVEQARALQFLIVGTTHESRYTIQFSGCLIDVAGCSMLLYQRSILGIGSITGNGLIR